MKLEVYPTYADQLNLLARTDQKNRGIWGDVVILAADLMDHEDGLRNAYPQRAEPFEDRDPRIRAALVKIARGSQRARWVFMSIAARETLRRAREESR